MKCACTAWRPRLWERCCMPARSRQRTASLQSSSPPPLSIYSWHMAGHTASLACCFEPPVLFVPFCLSAGVQGSLHRSGAPIHCSNDCLLQLHHMPMCVCDLCLRSPYLTFGMLMGMLKNLPHHRAMTRLSHVVMSLTMDCASCLHTYLQPGLGPS